MNEDVERLRSEVAELRTALERSRSQIELATRKVQGLELAQRVATMTESEDGGMVTPRVMVSHIPHLYGEEPKPYTVEWSDEDESWVMWLPDPELEALLYYNNVISSLTLPGEKSKRGDWWYKIPNSLLIGSNSWLCLKILWPSGLSPDPTTSWVNDYDVLENGCVVIIAEVFEDTTTGERSVLQMVDSALRVYHYENQDTEGFTGYKTRITSIYYDASSGSGTYELKYKTVEDYYENGLLKQKGTEETDHTICGTTPLTLEE